MSSSTQISGIPSEKARKTDCGAEHDHISNLPDCVISHILSGLPIEDAIRTSVLSKYWEYKWTSIHDVKLDDGKVYENKSKKATFVKFVERTLLLSQNMQSFSLSCLKWYESSQMKTRISSALCRNLHSLSISSYNARGLILPHNLFNCYSLSELELSMPIYPRTLKVPTTVCLPHLTTLYLRNLEILNEVSNSILVKFNFPVLETFELSYCKLLNVKFLEIYAPKMTRFTYVTPYDAGMNDYSIKITGVSLVEFVCVGSPENIVISGSTVLYANLGNSLGNDDLGLLEKSGLQIRKLLKEFSSLKDLHLSGNLVEMMVAKALFLSKIGLPLPRYCRMERLVLYSIDYSEVLLELLHAAPFLKFLVIHGMYCNDDYDYDAEEYYVPSCVVCQLEEVKFTQFCATTNMIKLVKFILKNAVKLKRLRVKCCRSTVPQKEINEIEEELCTYTRASACLNIVFTWVE